MQETRETRIQSLGRRILWRREWQPIPVFLPGKFHGQKHWQAISWGRKESDLTEHTAHIPPFLDLVLLGDGSTNPYVAEDNLWPGWHPSEGSQTSLLPRHHAPSSSMQREVQLASTWWQGLWDREQVCTAAPELLYLDHSGNRNGNPLHSMDSGDWLSAVHGVAKESDMT